MRILVKPTGWKPDSETGYATLVVAGLVGAWGDSVQWFTLAFLAGILSAEFGRPVLCLLHEAGHLAAALAVGGRSRVKAFVIHPRRSYVTWYSDGLPTWRKKVMVAAGPMATLFPAVLMVTVAAGIGPFDVGGLRPSDSMYVVWAFVLAGSTVINLVPAWKEDGTPNDGARLWLGTESRRTESAA